MRKMCIAALSSLFSLTALGQDLLQCVDPDVRNALLFSARLEGVMQITPALPASMNVFDVPADFELIGTSVRGGMSTSVAFTTVLSSAEAYAALRGALEAEGWQPEDDQSVRTFNVTSQPLSGRVCRNAERLSLTVYDVNGVRYATVGSYPDQRRLECNALDPRLALQGPAMFEAMRTRMPKLDFPTTATPADGRSIGGGMSGSGETVSTSSRIRSPDSAATLVSYLASQMTAQGWRRDAGWSGSLTSGSTWTLQGDDGRPYWGTLQVVAFDDDVYEVGFMLMAQPL